MNPPKFGICLLLGAGLANGSSPPPPRSQAMPDGNRWTLANLSTEIPESYCFNDEPSYCERYGRLYTWAAAQKVCSSLGPAWRLPSMEDWRKLAKVYGGLFGDGPGNGKVAYRELLAGGRSGLEMAAGVSAHEQESIRGVWKLTELASRAPGAGWEARPTPQLSQYIFTEKHYSYLYVRGSEPRKKFAGDPNNPTEAEKAEAYGSFVAATGTYSLSGRTLTLSALVHKNPNEMDGVSMTYTVELDGNTLRMVINDPPFLPGREWRTVLTKVE